MAVSLTNYTGDAGLGAGSNPGIPVLGNANLDVINQTGRDIMLMDNQRNMELFKQKVRDRDNLNEMIATDQVATGDVLPEYMPYFEQAKKKVEDVFKTWKGNYNDTKGFGEYKKAVQDLKDISGHAQLKTAELKKLEAQKAKEMLPRKKEDLQRWIDQQKKLGFWDPVTPYQQLHDFSMDDILSGVTEFSKETTDPNNAIYKYDEKYVDFNDVLRNKQNQYINDMDAADSIDQLFDKVQRLGPAQLGRSIDSINAQLQKYNRDRGLVQGMPGYAENIEVVPANGTLLIKEPKTDFAAKYALANRAAFTSRTPKFDKDIAKYGLDKERLSLQARKLGIDAAKAGAYIRNLDAKTRKFLQDEQAAGTNVVQQYEDFVNSIKPSTLKITQPSGKIERQDLILLNDLPQGYQFINGPVIALDKTGKPTGGITVGKLEPFLTTKDKRPYYVPRYVNSLNGEEITPKSEFVKNTYNTWKHRGYVGTIDDMMKTLLKNGALELTLKGRNGAANYTSMYQSAKALNAAGTTKGEENIMNPPADIPDEPQPE